MSGILEDNHRTTDGQNLHLLRQQFSVCFFSTDSQHRLRQLGLRKFREIPCILLERDEIDPPRAHSPETSIGFRVGNAPSLTHSIIYK